MFRCVSYFCYKIIKSPPFEFLVLMIILFNTVMLMLDDPTTDQTHPVVQSIEDFFLIAYTIEMCLKIVGLGFIFNKNGRWNG